MASAGHALCLFSLGLAKSWFHESRTRRGDIIKDCCRDS